MNQLIFYAFIGTTITLLFSIVAKLRDIRDELRAIHKTMKTAKVEFDIDV